MSEFICDSCGGASCRFDPADADHPPKLCPYDGSITPIWQEVEPAEEETPSIVFDHDGKTLEEAVSGCDKEIAQEIHAGLLENPEDYLGEKKSTAAEFLYDNLNDPNVLVAASQALIMGIESLHVLKKLMKEHGGEKESK